MARGLKVKSSLKTARVLKVDSRLKVVRVYMQNRKRFTEREEIEGVYNYSSLVEVRWYEMESIVKASVYGRCCWQWWGRNAHAYRCGCGSNCSSRFCLSLISSNCFSRRRWLLANLAIRWKVRKLCQRQIELWNSLTLRKFFPTSMMAFLR